MDTNQSYQPGQQQSQGYQQQQGYNQQTYNQGYQQQQGYNQQAYNQGYQQQQGYNQQNYNQSYQPSMRPYVESTSNNAFNCGPEGKCRGIYALFAMTLGSIGMHYFYVNKIGAAILTMVLVFITCGAWAVIPIIQGILAFWTMTNEEFDRKYVASNTFFPLF